MAAVAFMVPFKVGVWPSASLCSNFSQNYCTALLRFVFSSLLLAQRVLFEGAFCWGNTLQRCLLMGNVHDKNLMTSWVRETVKDSTNIFFSSLLDVHGCDFGLGFKCGLRQYLIIQRNGTVRVWLDIFARSTPFVQLVRHEIKLKIVDKMNSTFSTQNVNKLNSRLALLIEF